MATSQRRQVKTKGPGQTLSLKGSTKQVFEFFEYSVNSILYQRGIYPPDDFKMVKKYGLTLFTSADEALESYIQQVMKKSQVMLLNNQLSSLALVIITRDTKETVERWQFDIQTEDPLPTPGSEEAAAPADPAKPKRVEKTPEQIQKDIQDIMRQITSSVTFLPALEDKYLFNILFYAPKDVDVPPEFVEADAHVISGNTEMVKLRSFSTNRHKVEGLVAYKLGDL